MVKNFTDYESPGGLKNLFQTSFDIWPKMQSYRFFYHNAIKGWSIAMALILVALLIGTRNILISLTATINIGLVSLAPISIFSMQKGEVGIYEQLSLIPVLGVAI